MPPATAASASVLQSFCRNVFYYEGWLLLITGTLMLVAPEVALEAQGFSPAAVNDPVACGNLAQFGTKVVQEEGVTRC